MNKKSIGSHAAVMIVFAVVGLTMFTQDVRWVQIIGLFATGAVFGVSFGRMLEALRAGRKQ